MCLFGFALIRSSCRYLCSLARNYYFMLHLVCWPDIAWLGGLTLAEWEPILCEHAERQPGDMETFSDATPAPVGTWLHSHCDLTSPHTSVLEHPHSDPNSTLHQLAVSTYPPPRAPNQNTDHHHISQSDAAPLFTTQGSIIRRRSAPFFVLAIYSWAIGRTLWSMINCPKDA
jgi:hypothetical protein